jgi:type II secretory pathway component HofQ
MPLFLIFVFLLTVGTASAADTPPAGVPVAPCATAQGACVISKHDLKQARDAFENGLRSGKKQRVEEAMEYFQAASHLSPQDVGYRTAYEFTKQQVIREHLQRGNGLLEEHKREEALAEFQTALRLDPQNEWAMQRTRDALGNPPSPARAPVQVVAAASPVELDPKPVFAAFHFRGDSRTLLPEVARRYGISAIVDDSTPTRQVRFDLDATDFSTAMQAACAVTKTFWAPLSEHELIVAADNPDNRRAYEHMALRMFYLPGAASVTQLNDLANLLRTIFEVRVITVQPGASTITLRAPQRTLEAVTRFINALDSRTPQVMLEVRVYQVSHSYMRKIGLQVPTQFSLFNIPSAALQLVGGQNIQDLINQLIANGGINQANQTQISALLAQLQNQQNSLFSQPLATFGGGLTLFGLSLGTLTANLSLNESDVKSIEHAQLRAGQGNAATLHIGERVPILNASFAPIFNTPAISRVLANNSFQPAFPSFTYEDLGINLKAKPFVHGNRDVSLELEFTLKALGGTSLNGVPIISNREYKGQVSLKDGESSVVAGAINRTEQRSVSGLPLLAHIPGLHQLSSLHDRQENDDELLIVITPHVLDMGDRDSSREIWLPPTR